jgi:Zn-finger nucleic acid-binding protein
MKKARKDRKTGENLLICPRCGIYMKKIERKGVILDVCKRCKGMWFDAGEVEKLSKIMIQGGKK